MPALVSAPAAANPPIPPPITAAVSRLPVRTTKLLPRARLASTAAPQSPPCRHLPPCRRSHGATPHPTWVDNRNSDPYVERNDVPLIRPRKEHRLMTQTTGLSFGIATAPQQVTYHDVQRVWREADAIPEIEHAWLFDHLLPIAGDQKGPIFEGWTLLSALAAQTDRLRLGLLVTSNRFRPPAHAGQDRRDRRHRLRRAARLRHRRGLADQHPVGAARVRRQRPALPRRRLRGRQPGARRARSSGGCGPRTSRSTSTAATIHLAGAYCNPKPVQRPYPPIMIGGAASATLRVVAEHADVWNIPGRDAAGLALSQRPARPLLRGDRPRPGRDHPVRHPAGLL